jgi:hypothetical protein
MCLKFSLNPLLGRGKHLAGLGQVILMPACSRQVCTTGFPACELTDRLESLWYMSVSYTNISRLQFSIAPNVALGLFEF